MLSAQHITTLLFTTSEITVIAKMSAILKKSHKVVLLLILVIVVTICIATLSTGRLFHKTLVITNLSDNPIELSRLQYGIKSLRPGESGRCWFHGQLPHVQDREVFKRLGGHVYDCEPAPVLGARYSSEAEICRCTAPPAAGFSKAFLEIGSADGQYLSNLLFFEMQLNWRGICVEGSPSSFALLRVNRPSCATTNAVIGSDTGKRIFYTFDSPASWEIGMSCMKGTSCGKSDEEAQAYADKRELTLKKHDVEMRRLSDIFAEHNIDDFGWIMVDVEGAEDIVVPTIDLSVITSKFISYEGVHEEAMQHLKTGGYEESFKIGPDVFFEKRV